MLTDTMKSCIWFSATIWAMAYCAPLQAQTDSNPAPQKGAVKKLDGTKYFGLVEVTDDYTIRITNDAGITRLPITQLVDPDFQKYGFQKDRSKDGRFWYERKEALKDSPQSTQSDENSDPAEKPKGDDGAPVEIRLAEISAFQPLISAYEKTLASKKTDQSATPGNTEEKTDTSDPFKPLFSEPGLGGPLPRPFSLSGSPLQTGSGLQAPASTGGQIIQSATGASQLPSPR